MKSRTTAAILAIFLGGLGLHRFYLDKWITGLIYLVFCWTFIPAFLGLFEGIYYFMLNDSEFNATHNPGLISVRTTESFSADTHKKCPDCAEWIRKEARVCKHCGCKIPTDA